MTLHILSAHGKGAALWQSFVDRLPYERRDVLLTPAYARVQNEIGDGEAMCLCHDDGGELLPCLFNEHGELKSLYGGVNTWRDLGMEWRRTLGVTSEYRQTVGGWACSGEKVKDAVVVDLNYRENLIDGFSRNRRRDIAASEKITKVEMIGPKDVAGRFDLLYFDNMQRLGADTRWSRNTKVWKAYAEELAPEYLTMFATGLNESMLMVLHGYGKAHAHFIGGSKHHAILYYEAMKYCRDVDCETFMLGGGTTDKSDDPLLQYKLGFSKRTVPVYVYKTEYAKEMV